MKKIWEYLTLLLKSLNPSLRAQLINFKYLAIDRAQYKSLKNNQLTIKEPNTWWTYPILFK